MNIKTIGKHISLTVALLAACAKLALADPLGSAFTYLGRLSDGGSPATGVYDFQFVLCDAATNGAALGTNTVAAVPVTNGLYTVALDFGANAFDGNARWLALSVRTNGGIIWTALTPRLGLTPTPYAIRATTAGGVSGVIPDSQLSANIARLNTANVFTAPITAPSFSGSGSSLSGVAPATGSSNYVAKAGDTMIGPLNLPANGLNVGGSQWTVTNGNVGIGTTSPSAKLDVAGTVRATLFEGDGDFGTLNIGQAGTNNADTGGIVLVGLQYDNFLYAGNYLHHYGFGFQLFEDPLGPPFAGNNAYVSGFFGIDLFTGGTERMRVSRGGNVGIGTTSPGNALEIAPTAIGGYNKDTPASWNGLTITQRLPHEQSSAGILFQGSAPGVNGKAAIVGKRVGTDDMNLMFLASSDNGTTFTEAMTIQHDGNVGIGTTSPLDRLQVSGGPISARGLSATDGYITLNAGGPDAAGYINFFKNGPTRIAFLGYNYAGPDNLNLRLENSASFQITGRDVGMTGTLSLPANGLAAGGNQLVLANNYVGIGTTSPQAKLHVNGDLIVNGTNTVKVLSITGGSDVAEPFPLAIQEIAKGSVVVIDDEHPGQLKLSTEPYDQRVAGIVSGANGINPGITLSQQGALEGGQNVALSGRVYVLADAANALIKPGDLLTTSPVPGHAMKVTDHAKAQGAILGKAMSRLPEGRGLVLVLVTLQ